MHQVPQQPPHEIDTRGSQIGVVGDGSDCGSGHGNNGQEKGCNGR